MGRPPARGSNELWTPTVSAALAPALAAAWLLMGVPHANAFDLQGHRGARGLMPENTLAGFTHALALRNHDHGG